ncbi:MAG TPA: DUF885 domain-containing protein [Pseudonocardiaceae bacterium]|nr:DUF885 domain-containing protein [Pseudonocardiaceae bacterium]
MPQTPHSRVIRDLADAHVDALTEIDPFQATWLGLRDDRMRDLSPAGQEAMDARLHQTLAELDKLTGDSTDDIADADERRCAQLLRDRLTSELAVSESGEHFRAVRNILGPLQSLRGVFSMMPTATEDDWGLIARRMAKVPDAVAGYRATLTEGARRGMFAAPLQVNTQTDQIAAWAAAGDGRGWFADLASGAEVSAALRGDLDTAAAAAIEAFTDLSTWLRTDYLPRAEGTPDGVGAERYAVQVRWFSGADLDLAEAYEWAWSEYRRLAAEEREQADRVLPGATMAEAVDHLDAHGDVVAGVERIRERLQDVIDRTLVELDGTHFDMTDQMRRVECRIAPPGSAAAPYYTRPSRDFSRPGRTWLPVDGRTEFPMWRLLTTWYHESVPGHHLQLGYWTTRADKLSVFQTNIGSVSAMSEGWALYAERLMDELGYFSDPGTRLGFLDAQMRRAIRVIIDIGMHLGLPIPADSPVGAGERWNHELGLAMLRHGSPRDDGFVTSEVVRYLGVPAQAIGYKLGERAWLAGRAAAQQARGAAFDLKAWHMAALSLGSLGLDDLTGELARL